MILFIDYEYWQSDVSLEPCRMSLSAIYRSSVRKIKQLEVEFLVSLLAS